MTAEIRTRLANARRVMELMHELDVTTTDIEALDALEDARVQFADWRGGGYEGTMQHALDATIEARTDSDYFDDVGVIAAEFLSVE